jgi:hypothetical protein
MYVYWDDQYVDLKEIKWKKLLMIIFHCEISDFISSSSIILRIQIFLAFGLF